MKDKCARCGVEFNDGVTFPSPTTHAGMLGCIDALRGENKRLRENLELIAYAKRLGENLDYCERVAFGALAAAKEEK